MNKKSRLIATCCMSLLLVFGGTGIPGVVRAQSLSSTGLSTKFRQVSDTTTWKRVAAIPLTFPVHHPQGMVKIGSTFFLSSVEVIHRESGRGIGHLYHFDQNGKLLADVQLGEGAMYHPGGIDYDGKYIWVPVAEYRPHSRSIVYRVDPESLLVREVFRFEDHLGGIVHDTDAHSLHAVSWGSRSYYTWNMDAAGSPLPSSAKPATLKFPNPSFYIDYQDCHYAGQNLMLCGGIKNYKNGTATLRLGGMELVDLTNHQPVHQVPLPLWAPSGRPMTQNPFWLESTPTGLRAWFIPDDDNATMYVYEVVF